MLAIRVETETGETLTRITAERLGELVARIGGPDDRFLVVLPVPEEPDVFIQVWHEDGADYRLEHRDGGAARHFGTRLARPGEVAAAMTGWARRETGWDAGLVWDRVDLAVPELPDGIREKMEEHVRGQLRGGYMTRAELAEDAEEWLVDGGERPVSPAQAWQLVDRLWRERLEEQAGWEGTTDPERIAAVFAEIEERGITARENFTCCRSCGLSEIWGAGREDARGFVFFHTQCTDDAAAGGGLHLLYGGFDGSEETTASVGREVAAALRGAGLPVDWNGSPDRALIVTPLDWRKRLAD
ncbi:DUF6891 domain-containing protein [Streptomyces sp. GC420]|uniref:DUF6891 domain-containing protein n=1 Tax=Streptomyces sp. GC420 TaxID=2697568 RepID=UPI001414D6E2|nr:hypothetical protein [Streptomyces sp. GC420]NBM17560.1 hypothetical protein [Streptomyces sp. GC420]